mmetsp:Transcript_19937/g.45996  ORF Transcript_19937/g.45996 Transcript_19937/m.45996 type:complete len:85 (+) Transcript_19937:332-586(+)
MRIDETATVLLANHSETGGGACARRWVSISQFVILAAAHNTARKPPAAKDTTHQRWHIRCRGRTDLTFWHAAVAHEAGKSIPRR